MTQILDADVEERLARLESENQALRHELSRFAIRPRPDGSPCFCGYLVPGHLPSCNHRRALILGIGLGGDNAERRLHGE